MKYLTILIIFLAISCKKADTPLTAQQIIDKSIINSGVNNIANSEITFNFRGKNYTALRKNGEFSLSRTFKNKASDVEKDVVTNTDYKKYINNTAFFLTDSIKRINKNAVNSVHYFSVLPFGLNNKAVHKKLLKSTTIKGQEYYKIEITFAEQGGGEDFRDIFIYWIRKDNFLLDYLAYSYHTNGGGMRFRALKEQTIKNGIRFVNYNNYKPKNKEITLQDIDKAYQENHLEKISEINLENITVTPLN